MNGKAVVLTFIIPAALFLMNPSRAGAQGVTLWDTVQADGDTASFSDQQYSSAVSGSDGTLFIVWSDDAGGDEDVLFSERGPGGSLFTAPIRVDDGPPGTAQTRPRIAVNTFGDLFVAWMDDRPGNWDIRVARRLSNQSAFEPSVRASLDTSEADQTNPVMVVTGDSIAVAWDDRRMGETDIYYSWSTDGGQHFAANLPVNDFLPGVEQENPDIALDPGGAIYAVWQDGRDGGGSRIYISRSDDWSAGFSDDRLVKEASEVVSQLEPSVAAGPMNTVGVLWWDAGVLSRTATFARSSDGGQSFDDPVELYTSMFLDRYLSNLLVTADGVVHVAYNTGDSPLVEQCYGRLGIDERLVYGVSTDGGLTFGGVDVTGMPEEVPLALESPSVCVHADETVSLVWSDTRRGNSMEGDFEEVSPFGYEVRTNSVSQDTVPGRVEAVRETSFPTDHDHTSIAVGADGTIYMSWSEETGSGREIRCAMSVDEGETFLPPVPVAESLEGTVQVSPSIGILPDGQLHIAWLQKTGGDTATLLAAMTDDLPGGFSDPVVVSDTVIANPQRLDFDLELEPDDDGGVNLVWLDRWGEGYDIFFSKSTDGGQTFSPAVRVNTDSTHADQQNADMATDDDGDVYVVWAEGAGASREIRFRRSSGGGQSFGEEKVLNSEPVGAARPEPAIFMYYNSLRVTWFDTGELYTTMSTDRGQSFEQAYVARTGPEFGSAGQAVLLGTYDSFLVWSIESLDDWCVYSTIWISRKFDFSDNFFMPQVVNDDSTRYGEFCDAAWFNPYYELAISWTDPRMAAHTMFNLPPGPAWPQGNVFFRRATPIVGIDEPGPESRLPTAFRLEQNVPNPFNPVTTIGFTVPARSGEGDHDDREVRLAVYSLRGVLVRTLVEGPMDPGTHRVVWDGRDERGRTIASGVYFARLEAGNTTHVKKMVLLR